MAYEQSQLDGGGGLAPLKLPGDISKIKFQSEPVRIVTVNDKAIWHDFSGAPYTIKTNTTLNKLTKDNWTTLAENIVSCKLWIAGTSSGGDSGGCSIQFNIDFGKGDDYVILLSYQDGGRRYVRQIWWTIWGPNGYIRSSGSAAEDSIDDGGCAITLNLQSDFIWHCIVGQTSENSEEWGTYVHYNGGGKLRPEKYVHAIHEDTGTTRMDSKAAYQNGYPKLMYYINSGGSLYDKVNVKVSVNTFC